MKKPKYRLNRPHPPVSVAVQISNILDTSPDGIKVEIKKTAEVCWLPRAVVDFFPGHVVMPDWLARKIRTPK